MDFNFSKIGFNRIDKAFEGSAEQSIDAEITLPDYYPEVSKIHCCNAFAVISNRQCVNESISIGGQVNLNVIYSDSDGRVNLFATAVPFNKSVQASVNVDGMSVEVTPKINYINHKAVAPRKLEIHGSATLGLVCEDIKKEEILTETDDPDVYLKSEDFECLEPLVPITKMVYVEDDISVGSQPAIDKILRTDYYVTVSECKFVNGKAVLKGDLDVTVVYLCADGHCHKLVRRQGFSQIIECDGTNENTVCRATAAVVSFETRVKSSNEGENRLVGFEAKVETKLECWNKREFNAVCDAFSGKCRIEADFKKLPVVKKIETSTESFICSKNFELPESGGNIIDSFATVGNKYSAVDDGKLVVKGELNISTLYETVSGETAFYVKPIDFDYRCELSEDFSGVASASVRVIGLNLFGGNGGEVSAEVEIEVTVLLKETGEMTVLESISRLDSECSKMEEDTAVVLYFAENESVWDVAKMYGVDPKMVCKLNNEPTLDAKCNKILLVPNC
ncbi:MAG: DUF3794 domain-containing protein [Ruminococcaceae bacterium]|nr:DUF3794 domain-containing protein [Oscillospiraceae bacterium]